MYLKPNLIYKTAVRSYAFKSDLKIKWNRPEKIPGYDPRKSGDRSVLPVIIKSEFLKNYSKSRELETAAENVKKLFQLSHNPRKESVNLVKNAFIENVQRHSLDYGSMEAKREYFLMNIMYYIGNTNRFNKIQLPA